MANTRSAKKAIRQIERRTAVNRMRRSRMRSFIRKVEEAIARGERSEALKALQTAQPQIDKSAQHGLIHKNAAARKISRLSKRIKSLSG